MFHERARTFQGISLLLDALCILLAFGAALLLRVFHDSIPVLRSIPSIPWVAGEAPRSDYALLLIVNVAVWLAIVKRSALYLRGPARTDQALVVYVRAWVLSLLATGSVAFIVKMGSISRLFFAYYFLLVFALLWIKHASVALALSRISRRDAHRRHALVIGPSRPGAWFAEIVRSARNNGYSLAGLVLSDAEDAPEPAGIPVLGTVGDLRGILDRHPVEEVFIVGSAREMTTLAPVAQELIESGRTVSLVSTLSSGTSGVLGRITDFHGVPAISFGPMPRDEVRSGVKRLIDVAVAGFALIVLSPLMLAIGALIKLGDAGPALFVQERLGRGGRRFRLRKFRSMRVDAEAMLRADSALYERYVRDNYKLAEHEDPRVTPLGRVLRRTSLDELPQLWNVLTGDMTLVGPRPIVPEEIEKYKPYADLFLSVRPGLTGHWQVAGRSSVPYPERAFLDLDYVGKHSVTDDLSLLLRTVPAVLKRKGAY